MKMMKVLMEMMIDESSLERELNKHRLFSFPMMDTRSSESFFFQKEKHEQAKGFTLLHLSFSGSYFSTSSKTLPSKPPTMYNLS